MKTISILLIMLVLTGYVNSDGTPANQSQNDSDTQSPIGYQSESNQGWQGSNGI